MAVLLRPGKTPSGAEVRILLKHLTRRIRRHWPRTRLTFRGDSHYGRTEAVAWCEANGVDYRKLSRHSPVAKAMDYMLRRWDLFARFLDDGRICFTNNAAERGLRGIALGRKSWLFCGSDRGGTRAAAMYTLIGTAKLNNVDPQAWLADVLGRIAGTPQSQLDELLPWNWQDNRRHDQAA